MMLASGHVVVITGASSGIGRLASLTFAGQGANVLVAARNERGLATLAAEADGLPGSITTVVLDVANHAAVQDLARLAVGRFGRIDTWINNAGVMVYARLADTSTDELRRILDVNVIGVHNGMRAAFDVMTAQRHGTIVNVGSVESIRAFPLQSAYAASKHAVKALTEAFRVELQDQRSPVRLVLIEPSYINTPLFDHARSKIGRRPRPVPPLYEPEAVVRALVHVATQPIDEVVIGGSGRLITWIERFSPRLSDIALRAMGLGFRAQRSDEPPHPIDNVDGPIDEGGAARGRWSSMAFGRSLYTDTVGLHRTSARLALAGLVASVVGLAAARR
jgi:NADP-dependent 3-hydroxy acid dehydrogenase YdfG